MLVERVQTLSRQGVSVDIMTSLFRSEGIADVDIRDAYTAMCGSNEFSVEVERGIPFFVPA